MGIEPTLFAWEAKVLPLNYTRVVPILVGCKTPRRIFMRHARWAEGRAASYLLRAKPGDDTPLCIKQAQRSGFHVEAGDSRQRREKGAFLPHAGVAGARGHRAFSEAQGAALKRVAQQELVATARARHAPRCRLQNNVRLALFFNRFNWLLVESFKLPALNFSFTSA